MRELLIQHPPSVHQSGFCTGSCSGQGLEQFPGSWPNITTLASKNLRVCVCTCKVKHISYTGSFNGFRSPAGPCASCRERPQDLLSMWQRGFNVLQRDDTVQPEGTMNASTSKFHPVASCDQHPYQYRVINIDICYQQPYSHTAGFGHTGGSSRNSISLHTLGHQGTINKSFLKLLLNNQHIVCFPWEKHSRFHCKGKGLK